MKLARIITLNLNVWSMWWTLFITCVCAVKMNVCKSSRDSCLVSKVSFQQFCVNNYTYKGTHFTCNIDFELNVFWNVLKNMQNWISNNFVSSYTKYMVQVISISKISSLIINDQLHIYVNLFLFCIFFRTTVSPTKERKTKRRPSRWKASKNCLFFWTTSTTKGRSIRNINS